MDCVVGRCAALFMAGNVMHTHCVPVPLSAMQEVWVTRVVCVQQWMLKLILPVCNPLYLPLPDFPTKLTAGRSLPFSPC